MKKLIYLSLFLMFLIPFSHAFANDTDLYILTQLMQQVPPDALIILDLSGSMNWTPAGATLYVDQSSHCNNHSYSSSYSGPYYSQSGSLHTYSCSSIPYSGSNLPIYGDASCSDATGFYQSSSGTHTTNCSKLAMAKRGIFALLDTDNGSGKGTPDGIIDSNDQAYLKIRMGYMRFYNCSGMETVNTTSYNSGCNTLIDPLNTSYSTIYCNSSSCTVSSSGSGTCVAHEQATGGTPLAAALNEANYYLTYTKSSDTDAACRQKFVILITDGSDTYACSKQNGSETSPYQYMGRRETVAQARALANAGYYVFVVGFGADMPYYQQNTLNWAAYYGKTKNTDATQSITTMYSIPYQAIYPAGIGNCQTSATATAPDGHYYATTFDPGQDTISGYAFIAQNESQLDDAISNIRNFIITLIAQSTSYVAPVVPISQFQSTNSENRMYLGMFKPTATTMWKGNIKKYGIQSTDTTTIKAGDVIDATGKLAIDKNTDTIISTAQSYWSATQDGGDVEKGGLGAILVASTLNSRNIYTYLGTNTNLTNSSNAFSKTNAAITPTLLGLTSTDTTDRNNIIDFVHGWDVWNWNNGPGNPRDWILGAFIHSRPLVIHYGSQDVVYAGANDGMLHAFDDATGNELWAFIPPDLLPNLKNFNNSLASLQISVDGSPKAYITYNYNSDGSIKSVSQAILIFGERRGGNYYYALDVTSSSAPNLLWSISPSTPGYGGSAGDEKLGQSWSTPVVSNQILKVPQTTSITMGSLCQHLNSNGNCDTRKPVAFIGGGYDATNEDTTPVGTDTSGRAIYIVDVTNGNLIWKYSHSNDANMKYCIPSDITAVDLYGDGLIERLYVGDVGGQVWRFDLCSSATGKCIPNVNSTANWSGKRVFTASGKIFYPPDVTFETNIGKGTYNMLFFGTGDREKPNDTTVVNTLYAVKDYDTFAGTISESSLVDVTSDVLQTGNATQKAGALAALKSGSGWFIRLNESAGENPNPGEKCDAGAVVLGGVAYYTTFTPTPINTQSVCSIGTGQGNLYMLQYQTGESVFDPNNNTLTVNDRSINIGSGIPSGITLTVINGTVTGYGGVADGVFSPRLTTQSSGVPLDWRIVF